MASFAELLAQNQPKIQTRQALMVIGLQNDFISPDGRLPVNTKTGFLDHIHTLIPKFRELNGHIIWVQTLYEADRLANTSSTGEGDALVIGGLVDGDESSTEGGDDESTKDLPLPVPQAQSRSAKHKQRALDLFKRVSARRKTLPVEEAKATVEEDEELFLLKRAKRDAACMPETDGAQFTKEIKELIETPRDAVIKTTNYSAFLGTNLLMTLRARLVTEIYVCGCLTNISVLATVIDGARHGIKINVVQDALGFRKQTRHDLALKRMEDFFDAWLVTSADILAKEHLAEVKPEDEAARPTANGSNNASNELEALVGKLSLADKSNATSKVSNGHLSPASNGQLKSKNTPSSDTRSNTVAEDDVGNEELTAALARTRRTKDAELRSTETGESKLVQSKTRMRLKGKKKKKTTEGSSVEPGMPNGESSKHGAGESSTATHQAVDSLKTAEPDAKAERNGVPKQMGTGEPSLDTTSSELILPTTLGSKENPANDANPSSAKTPPDESKEEIPVLNSELPSTALADASISAVTLPQSTPAKSEAPSRAPSRTVTTTEPSKLKSLANLPVLGPGDHIAEGDSRIVHDLIPVEYHHPSELSKPLAELIFQQLYNEVRWQKMLHQQGEVPRLVCCQGEFSEDGSKPVYRHPTDQSLPLLHFSSKVQWIRRAAEKLVGHPLNHVLIQLYRSGNDYISEHSDKTLDIAKGSSIVNVSFGAQRTMRLRTKRDSRTKPTGGDQDTQRETQRIAMPHNSMFVLGLKSNEKWLHGIMADKRIKAERSEPETAYSGVRISLTFRHIVTFLDAKETTIWGQGATSKDQRGAADVVNNDKTEAERMIRAFSRENQSNEFSWDESYGDGFDVLHLHEPPEQLPILFAGSNAIETKQIQLALWESKVNHTLIEAPVLDTGETSTQQIHFRDNDTHSTEVSGVSSILLYLDRYYSLSQSPDSKPVTAAAYSILELLSRVSTLCLIRPTCATPVELTATLRILGEQLKNEGGPFIAGKRFSIADCLAWPIIDELAEKWQGWDELEFPELSEYWRGLWRRKGCVKRLRGELPAGAK
jgi:nicotinamidase-related amidase/alkylated DNA repair dioxygenase AlkB